MARLPESLLERIETLCDRTLDVALALEEAGVSRRIVDQISASGTSIGANAFEADEGMSRADFVRSLCVAVKELNETLFWIRLTARRNWIAPTRLEGLQTELVEIKKVLGSIISRTKAASRSAR